MLCVLKSDFLTGTSCFVLWPPEPRAGRSIFNEVTELFYALTNLVGLLPALGLAECFALLNELANLYRNGRGVALAET